jgi:hypothetical protein
MDFLLLFVVFKIVIKISPRPPSADFPGPAHLIVAGARKNCPYDLICMAHQEKLRHPRSCAQLFRNVFSGNRIRLAPKGPRYHRWRLAETISIYKYNIPFMMTGSACLQGHFSFHAD